MSRRVLLVVHHRRPDALDLARSLAERLREAGVTSVINAADLRGFAQRLDDVVEPAGLVDRLQVTIFPVITGKCGTDPVLGGAADFDLELLEHRTLDGDIQELVYRPTLHVSRS